ncbi:hypothetical protein Csa_004658, partial [Cucumis sativus]
PAVSIAAAVVPRADLPSPSPVMSPSKPRPPRGPVTATLPAHNRRSTCYRRRPTSCCNRSDLLSVRDGFHP